MTPLLLLLLACGAPVDESAAKPVSKPVKVFEVDESSGAVVRDLPAVVKAPTSTLLSFEVAGQLVAFPVREGQVVARGDVLARIDPSDYAAELAAMRARVSAARAEYEREREQFAKQATSQAAVDAARRDYQVLESKLRITEKALEEATLVAPYDGIVARKLVGDYANLKAKEAVLLLEDARDLQVEAVLSERDFARAARAGLPTDIEGVVTIHALPGHEFPARLKEFSTSADPTTRTFSVTFSFDADPTLTILPGMTASLRVEIAAPGVTQRPLVPVSAVRRDDRGDFLWVLEEGAARRVDITLGDPLRDLVTVHGDLPEHALVVTSGLALLEEGAPIRPWAGVPH